MSWGAVAAVILGLFLVGSGYKFQRFTLAIARTLKERGTETSIPDIQMLMTPVLMGSLVYAGYALGAISAVLGFLSFGWWWLLAVAALMVFAPGILNIGRSFPSRQRCISMADAEITRTLVGSGDVATRGLCASI